MKNYLKKTSQQGGERLGYIPKKEINGGGKGLGFYARSIGGNTEKLHSLFKVPKTTF